MNDKIKCRDNNKTIYKYTFETSNNYRTQTCRTYEEMFFDPVEISKRTVRSTTNSGVFSANDKLHSNAGTRLIFISFTRLYRSPSFFHASLDRKKFPCPCRHRRRRRRCSSFSAHGRRDNRISGNVSPSTVGARREKRSLSLSSER